MLDPRHIQRSGPVPRTVASFFSGGGGATLGLVRAGWTPVSFSEIERFPIAVLEAHWPDVPQLGDITAVEDVPDATLWLSGAPCQDLSIAGGRQGLAGERSGLAYTFLGLVERHRPRAVLMENVTGLLSSNGGKDLGALLGILGELRYGWAFRVLDAEWFGVPQRRKRVFILALDLERHPDEGSAAEVLAIGTRCPRHHDQEREAWQAFTRDVEEGTWFGHSLGGPSPDPHGGGETDGIPGRLHDPQGLDSHRFKVIGNGVVASMTQWIGQRLDARLP